MEVIQITLEKLRSLHYIDDETFARDWARTRIAGRGYGPLRIERELRGKGVEAQIIRRVLSEHFSEREGRERGQALLARRFCGQDLTDVKILRRAVGFLQRRGYTNAVIEELIRQPVEDESEG